MSLLRVHFARRQANVAGYVLSCHFRHADLATGETGNQRKVTKLQILMLGKQWWRVSPGLYLGLDADDALLSLEFCLSR